MPTNCGPLNNKEEGFSYYPRQEREVKEFKMFLQIAPEIPEGPEPYYQKVYKPLTDVLQKIYPTDYAPPPLNVAEGNTIPIKTPPYSEYHDLNNPDTCTWRLHPLFRDEEYAKDLEDD